MTTTTTREMHRRRADLYTEIARITDEITRLTDESTAAYEELHATYPAPEIRTFKSPFWDAPERREADRLRCIKRIRSGKPVNRKWLTAIARQLESYSHLGGAECNGLTADPSSPELH